MNLGILFQELHYIQERRQAPACSHSNGKAMRRGLLTPDHLTSQEATRSLTVEELGDLPQLPTAQTSPETPTPAPKEENASFRQPSHEQRGNNLC